MSRQSIQLLLLRWCMSILHTHYKIMYLFELIKLNEVKKRKMRQGRWNETTGVTTTIKISQMTPFKLPADTLYLHLSVEWESSIYCAKYLFSYKRPFSKSKPFQIYHARLITKKTRKNLLVSLTRPLSLFVTHKYTHATPGLS